MSCFRVFLVSVFSTAALLLPAWCAAGAAGKGLPAGIHSGTVQVTGGSIFYEVAGTGEPLVLVHDGLLHREVYDAQFAPFARHFTVVRYDRRGYGRSPVSSSPFSNVEDLLRLLDELKIGQASLVGMSAGGGLCVDFTLAHPDRVKALVLVGAVVSGLGYTDHFNSRGGHLRRADLADDAATMRYWAMEDPYEIAPENTAAKERVHALLEANPQDLDLGKFRLSQPPPRPALGNLGEIRVPTLIVIGEHDIPDVHAHGGALEGGIAGARRIIIQGAGHIVPLERPEEFNDAVLGFLRGADFFVALQAGDAGRAASLLRRLRETDPDFAPASENELNAAGYRLLQERKPEQAVEIFRLNTELHPDSWNVWDSLGEGQAAAGDTEAAVASYRKSLDLNPASDGGRQAIEQLEGRLRAEAGETREPSRLSPGQSTGLEGPYLGQKPPGVVPEIFAPGIVSTRGNNEFSITFSPDGEEMYFNRGPDIHVSRWEKDGWTAPAPVPFNAPDLDHEAHITSDGSKLYFGSRRPRPGLEAGEDPYGIWVMERRGDGWGEPRYHGPGMYATTTARGDIYVTDITPPDRRGIVRRRLVDGRYGAPEKVEGGPNSPDLGAHPCVAPDGSFLVFDVNKEGTPTGADLKVSFLEPDGTWGEAIDLGDAVNTDSGDYAASLSPDGKYLFFSRNRDIYWVRAEILERLRPKKAR